MKEAGCSGFRVVEFDTHMDYGCAKQAGVGLDGGERFADEVKLSHVIKSTGSETGGLGIRRLTEMHVGVVGKGMLASNPTQARKCRCEREPGQKEGWHDTDHGRHL